MIFPYSNLICFAFQNIFFISKFFMFVPTFIHFIISNKKKPSSITYLRWLLFTLLNSTYIKALRSHCPCTYRFTNKIPLNTQSSVMAIQTPNTPSPNHFPRTTLQKILNIHMVAVATTIQYFTSFAALNVFGIVNAGGQIVTQHNV